MFLGFAGILLGSEGVYVRFVCRLFGSTQGRFFVLLFVASSVPVVGVFLLVFLLDSGQYLGIYRVLCIVRLCIIRYLLRVWRVVLFGIFLLAFVALLFRTRLRCMVVVCFCVV